MKAFPAQGYNDGMDLRDYFAASIMINLNWTRTSSGNKQYDGADAQRCYEIADAMIKAREEKK